MKGTFDLRKYDFALHTTFLALMGALLTAVPTRAQTSQITLNTGPLSGQGIFYVEFTLTDGTSSGAGSSTATVSGFNLTGGTLGAVLPPTTGSVSGALSRTMTLTDSGLATGGSTASSDGLADFAQAFTVTQSGSILRFNLTLSASNVTSGPTPDDFTFKILDGSETALATNGPTGMEFLDAQYTTIAPMIQGYVSTDPTYTPSITATVSPAPEPSSVAVLGLGFLGMAVAALRARLRSRFCVENQK